MLDPDISTHDAYRLLSRRHPDHAGGPGGITRRHFLAAIGMGAVAAPALGSFRDALAGSTIPEEWVGAPLTGDQAVIIVISLYGGNDGLNTVVPIDDGAYFHARPGLAIAASDVLPIGEGLGLHPSLPYLRALSDAGQVAIVQGVGDPRPDYSHFRSMGVWMDGSLSGGRGTGWLGRWLDGQPSSVGELGAVSLDVSVPLHVTGVTRRAVGVSPAGDGFGTDQSADKRRLFDTLSKMSAAPAGRGSLHDAFAATMRRQLELVEDLQPVFSTEAPAGEMARKLTIAARLINADLGVRIIDVGRSGFDTHTGQVAPHRDLLADLDEGLRAFFATLAPEKQNRVTLMTVSEFGRTVGVNGSGGTDHGSAAPLFVIGSAVKGGLYGQAPSLTRLDGNGQMTATVDFRSIYGTVIDGWMGGGGSDIVGGSFERFDLFRSGPGGALTGRPTPIVVVPPSTASGFTPMAPRRLFDTRDGTGGRATPLGAREGWTVPVRDLAGLPADAVAVAINLTAVGATVPTYVTAWPSGLNRPLASNLNPVPGMAVPNMAIVRLGADGGISLYNNAGSVHLVGDIVGWFSPSSVNGLVPLVPARVLDTRDGTGGRSGAIGQGETIDLQVIGHGGVPAGTVAVALNVAVTEPTAAGYLTVYPSGVARPLASNVNMVAGQTVPNLVLCGVGANGCVSIVNSTGATHVVADVLGAFVPYAGGKYVALPPARVLDTRDGTGADRSRIGQRPLVVPVRGRGGVPAGGVGAVVMNVTAVAPSRDTYVTVHPSDVTRPLAANLNVVAGQVIPNLVVGRPGADGGLAFSNNGGDVDLVADVVGYFTT
jgi:uncharacterized protein (DUF1501 family)